MIGRLQGTVIDLSAPHALIDCHGVGYEVETPMPTFCQLRKGETATLWTHQVVREDAHLLFGFATKDDRLLFRLLLKVSGVGPKLALSLLSGMEPAAFLHCIEREDIAALTRIPGVGKKTAERLLIEMRDRIKELSPTSSRTPQARLSLPADLTPVEEAEQALLALGYKPAEAQKSVAAISHLHENSADLIRAALKAMIK